MVLTGCTYYKRIKRINITRYFELCCWLPKPHAVMYNVSGKTGFDQARYTNKNAGTTLHPMSTTCQDQIEIYVPTGMSGGEERKASVLLADTQRRHATQTIPEHQTTACTITDIHMNYGKTLTDMHARPRRMS